MNKVYLLLGGNMGNRAATLERAEARLAEVLGPVRSGSTVYETAAWGMGDAPAFLNRVIEIHTQKTASEILSHCLETEKFLGRTRSEKKNESRAIDIDLLFFNDAVIHCPDLEVPHPRIHLRRFVLVPLNEIAPEFIHPTLQKKIKTLLKECPDKLQVSAYSGLKGK
jgi:2-amino-4-hydroxy-6-hydroxymethyldihydropteridine diphosphokinase